MPVLETARLLLRPMRDDDTDALLVIFSDPQVMQVMAGGSLFDRLQMQHWVQRNRDHQAEYGYGLFSVIQKSSGMLIGDCGLEQMEDESGRFAELGYDFRSDCWNQGFATEAATAVRDFALHELRLPELVSLIRAGNHASRRVAEKVGMTRAAEFTRHGHPYWRYALPAEAEPVPCSTASTSVSSTPGA